MERGRENGCNKEKICKMNIRIRQDDTKLYNRGRGEDEKYENRGNKACNKVWGKSGRIGEKNREKCIER